MRKFILFLIRRKLGLRKYQHFQYANQKSNAEYFFGDQCIVKMWKDKYDTIKCEYSHVSVNWILSDECEIIKL